MPVDINERRDPGGAGKIVGRGARIFIAASGSIVGKCVRCCVIHVTVVILKKCTPASREVGKIKALFGGKGFKQHKGLISVMCERPLLLCGVVGIRCGLQEGIDPTEHL